MEQVVADQATAFARDGVVLAGPGPLALVASAAGEPGGFTGDFCRWREIPRVGQLARY